MRTPLRSRVDELVERRPLVELVETPSRLVEPVDTHSMFTRGGASTPSESSGFDTLNQRSGGVDR